MGARFPLGTRGFLWFSNISKLFTSETAWPALTFLSLADRFESGLGELTFILWRTHGTDLDLPTLVGISLVVPLIQISHVCQKCQGRGKIKTISNRSYLLFKEFNKPCK